METRQLGRDRRAVPFIQIAASSALGLLAATIAFYLLRPTGAAGLAAVAMVFAATTLLAGWPYFRAQGGRTRRFVPFAGVVLCAVLVGGLVGVALSSLLN